jgi:hypothetical protein
MAVSGGLVVTTTAPELTVNATGVTLGNVIGDTHNITGSVGISGSLSGIGATFSSKISANTSNGIFSNFGGTSIGTTSGSFTGISLGYSENTTYTKTAIVQEQINDGAARGHLHFLVDIANDGNNAVLGDSKMMINGLTGNVGIGISSPSRLLHLSSSSDVYMQVDRGSITSLFGTDNVGTYIGQQGAFDLRMITNATERMRITSAGNVLIGTTSVGSQGTLNSYTNNANPAGRFISGPSTPDGNIVLMVDKYSSTNTTSQWFLGFTISNQGVASGVITANGASQAAFGSWSDRRLKENITDLEPQLHKILALRPVEFDYIKSEGGGHQISFIAQEFEEVYPDAVGERQDGMKTLTGWSKTEARLVKAIQELKAEIDELKNK